MSEEAKPDVRPMRIDFVSDVVCPWCVIGLRGLQLALERLRDEVRAEIHLHPFELNPAMGPDGQNIAEHIAEKYGSTPEQSTAARQTISERAASVGFAVATNDQSRIFSTFDAHRLLHMAAESGDPLALKHQLFEAYFTDGRNVSDHRVLLDAAEAAGLDRDEAAQVLESGAHADTVRAEERLWQSRGITSVPAIIIDQQYLISGGQPPEVFEQALRSIAAESRRSDRND